MKRALLLAGFSLTLPVVAAAQQPVPKACQDSLKTFLDARTPKTREDAANTLVEFNDNFECLAQLLTQTEQSTAPRDLFVPFLKALEAQRTDKQSGSSTGTGGSTNLVSKGTTAKILSIATEYGALTETVSKQVVTVSGSLDGIPAALFRQHIAPYCASSDPSNCGTALIETLQRFSYSVAFDTSQSAQGVSGTPAGVVQGTAQPVTFAADGHSITGVTVRAVLWNDRDTLSKTFQQAWKDKIKNNDTAKIAATSLRQQAGDFLDAVSKVDGYETWKKETVRQLLASPGKAKAVWEDRVRVLADMLQASSPDLGSKATDALEARGKFRFEEDAVVATLKKPIATLQYDYKQPTNQPTTSTLRLILDKGMDRGWSFALNGAVELYNNTPSPAILGAGPVRDTQVGAQLQKDLGKLDLVGAAALAGTYYYQYQNSPSILNVTPGTPLDGINLTGLPSTATQVFATPGNIHVFQLRLVIGPGQSGARIPFSVTYSNRTELIDKPTWRAQIGVSYDFDSLFGTAKAVSPQ